MVSMEKDPDKPKAVRWGGVVAAWCVVVMVVGTTWGTLLLRHVQHRVHELEAHVLQVEARPSVLQVHVQQQRDFDDSRWVRFEMQQLYVI